MKTIIYEGNNCTIPPIIKKANKNLLSFTFTLMDGWEKQLALDDEDTYTHKVAGISDLFGRNSVRLGIRKAPVKNMISQSPEFMYKPFMYIHRKGNTIMLPIYNFIIIPGVEYRCNIGLDNGMYYLDICRVSMPNIWNGFNSLDYVRIVEDQATKIWLFPRLAGPWFETKDEEGPSFDLTTEITIIK
jgi:hypothetical protein